MKKFNIIITYIIFFFLTLPVHAQTTVIFNPSLYFANAGNSVTVTFTINNAVNVHSATIKLIWDPSKVTFTNASEGSFFPNSGYSTMFNFQPQLCCVTDSIYITDALLGPYGTSGSGTVCTVTFTANTNGTAIIKMDTASLFYPNLTYQYVTHENGIINIGPGVIINSKIFLQGPYNLSTGLMNKYLDSLGFLPLNQPYNNDTFWGYHGTESLVSNFYVNNPNITDWVLLELRQTPTSSPEQRIAALLKTDGSIVDYRTGSSPVLVTGLSTNSYYLVIRHQNHLAVMSNSALSLSSSSSLYDFTVNSNQFYGYSLGAACPLGNGLYGMYAGDVDQNGNINSVDKNYVYNARSTIGYSRFDIDRNGNVNSVDKNITYNNRSQISRVP